MAENVVIWLAVVCIVFGFLAIGLAVYELWKFAKEMADLERIEP